MKWSWKIGSVAGIDIYVHGTFAILLAWIALSHARAGAALPEIVGDMAFVVLVFAIVVLHELGHALMARRFGVRTKDITLLPIGGLARLEKLPEEPRHELLIALAGPAVNVALAVLLIVVTVPLAQMSSISDAATAGGNFLAKLFWVNVVLAAFNLIPAFPMDGGRVLRALLSMGTDRVRATEIAAAVGQVFAVLIGLVGALVNPFLVLIALFVWLGAAGEARAVRITSSLAGVRVARVMITEFCALAPAESLADAIRHVLAGFQHDFPVVEGGKVLGMLTRQGLLRALAQFGTDLPVRSAMNPNVQVVQATEMVEQAYARLQEIDCRSMPVVYEGRLVGIVTLENVAEFLMFASATQRSG
ncbi:MAG: site-2 protease family protein [Candidatus Schekmanbacteria bacterium]|nr:site-2 protease family protein [Candidatus Schekmanbacteria bacterium]